MKVFWESHDPTQGMRQGSDVGTQYRSGIYVADAAQRRRAEGKQGRLRKVLAEKGLGCRSRRKSSTRPTFYYAEGYHQQYLAKNPNGYCGLGGTGVACPIGVCVAA